MSQLNRINVLDRGHIILCDSMGNDLSVCRSARVSFDAAWRTGEDKGSDKRLLNYLWKNKHTSPFESVTFTFEVKAPIFVFRQWQRSRTWSYNEISGRYTELKEEFYIPNEQLIGKQSESNKQARNLVELSPAEYNKRITQTRNLENLYIDIYSIYKSLIEDGWPRELARTILPVSTYSTMFATVNLLNLLKFIGLREAPDAQYEIRVYADAIKELIRPVVPVIMEIYESNNSGQ